MKDNVDQLFKDLNNTFDIEEPNIGHFNRFQEKLKLQNKSPKKMNFNMLIIPIAATILLFFGIWIGKNFRQEGMQLASISPKMEETQNYFIATIQKELETVALEKNNTTEQLINDALKQLEKLEIQYNNLTHELKQNSEDQRIIYAMISNFQQRIQLLQDLLNRIEQVKQLKKQENEKYV
jgi:hypothetical protein